MPRQLRFEYPGAVYHVFNHGSMEAPALARDEMKELFERCLFETCERAGWTLHAYCLLENEYQLAITTRQANLSSGMRWLKSAFAARGASLRRDSGPLFQGRFRSILVEDDEQLARLCDYINLAPARTGRVKPDALVDYRFASPHWLATPRRQRPLCLSMETALAKRGGLKDTAAGRRKYAAHLAVLSGDEQQQAAYRFHRMRWGWAYGSKTFKKRFAKAKGDPAATLAKKRTAGSRARQREWKQQLETGLQALGKSRKDAAQDKKSADWKVALCAWMRQSDLVPNGWLTEQLSMGVEASIPQRVKQLREGQRPEAARLLRQLETRASR